MEKAYTLLFTLCFLLTGKAIAQQPGYIITLKNDTVKGITQGTMFTRIKLKTAGETEFKTINPDTIKEYQYTKDSSVYVSLSLPANSMNMISKPQFVQRLAGGKIKLYELLSGRYQLRTWYAGKGTDTLVAIKTDDMALIGGGSKQKRREKFAAMLNDQPGIFTAFNAEKRFSFDNILLYVKRYNAAASAQNK